MRPGTWTAIFGLACAPLASCRAVVDSGVSVHACPPGAGGEDGAFPYFDDFFAGTTREHLLERCWRFENEDVGDMFPDDGDFVARVSEGGAWDGASQGPLMFQRLEDDFVLAVRVEILNQVDTNHCLATGNGVGLVVRQSDVDRAEARWSTLLIGIVPGPYEPPLRCDGDEAEVPPTVATVRSRDDAWGGQLDVGGPTFSIGFDGEADIAVCRLNDVLTFYYREPQSPTDRPVWTQIRSVDGSQAEHRPDPGPVDVGLTASGAPGQYQAEAHFQWSTVVAAIAGDGCAGVLEGIPVPGTE